MRTGADLVSELELRLTGGKPSNDSQLDRRQLRRWVDDAFAELFPTFIRANGGEVSGNGYLWFDGVDVLQEQLTTAVEKGETNRYYCVLPAQPIELDNEGGIKLVENSQGQKFTRQRPYDRHVVKHLKFSKPKLSYHRVGLRLVLDVPKQYLDSKFTLNLLMLVAPTAEDLPDNANYPCPNNLVLSLLDRAEQIGRKQTQTPQDGLTDGADNRAVINKQS